MVYPILKGDLLDAHLIQKAIDRLFDADLRPEMEDMSMEDLAENVFQLESILNENR